MNLQDFYNGNEWFAYRYFGAQVENGGVRFTIYAPKAKKVTLIGEFNFWHDCEMSNNGRGGIYSVFVENAKPGQMYKYRIYHHDGTVTDKADPYGFGMELRPCSASIIRDMDAFGFTDGEWMQRREKNYNKPMHIYELHFGTWRCNGDKWYQYEELETKLIPYLKEMGYTHVELMPISEYPLDESWGYQSTGFFAPTARYGTCDGLKEFVNQCHNAGIGVLLDFVMVHFAVDDYGLGWFDGSPLYELPFEEVEHSEWGSYQFAHGKGEVASFLKSCANYWLSEYHFDGLRMDAISNMIYWQGNKERGVNEEALRFVQSLNEGLHQLHPSAMLVAEDSTSFLKVTAPVPYGGLGFDYKWDLGWMHDTLEFFRLSPEERRTHYRDILFSMHYFYNELYLLPLSHDEVVHGKKTILDKMYGSYEEKFAQCRALFLYMLTHPGKKLNFMGNEIGQFREWAEYRPQDFDVLEQFPMHTMFKRFFRDINHVYLSHPALYSEEYNRACFEYIIADKPQDLVYAYTRNAGGERMLAVFNFSDRMYNAYEVRVPGNHMLKELVNSASEIYGGAIRHGGKGSAMYGVLGNDVRDKRASIVNGMEIPIRNGHCRLDLEPYSGRLFAMV